MNLLELGEGPFPLPIGQSRQDVEKQFKVTKVAAVKDISAKTLQGLVPGTREIAKLDDEEIIGRLTTIRGAWWALRALTAAKRQLRSHGLNAVRLPAPPDVSPAL